MILAFYLFILHLLIAQTCEILKKGKMGYLIDVGFHECL